MLGPFVRWRVSIRRSVGRIAVVPRTRVLVAVIGAYSAAFVALLAASTLSSGDTTARAIVAMMLGLVALWVVAGGSVMYAYRDRFAARARAVPLDWRVTFVLSATALALAEEAVTVTMTNLAPVLGADPVAAHITASTNYVHVVLFHSVVVFVPMFVAWAFLLSRYDFEAVEVFLLFGLTGTLAEATVAPVNALGGFWFFVYGLMVYLPTYSTPPRPTASSPRARHYVLAVALPLVAGALTSLPVVYVRQALGIDLWAA